MTQGLVENTLWRKLFHTSHVYIGSTSHVYSHDDSDEMLRCLAKIEHYVITKSTSKPKQLKITDMFAKK